MTSDALARIYALAFPDTRPWSASEFDALRASPTAMLFSVQNGFAVVQVVAREAELITIAVAPDAQGQGVGAALMTRWMAAVKADEAFLEVAADNAPARRLYNRLGFAEIARRRGYYTRKNCAAIDAIVMRRPLP